MVRPAFRIDQVRLRAVREEQGLSQATVARKVASLMGRPVTDSLTRHYQRIEDTGQTSSGYAKALAKVLGTSVPLLQGHESPEPYGYLQYVRRLLDERLAAGGSDALQALLARQGAGDREAALSYLTEVIAERIEQVLLVRNHAMVADLVSLTGLSENEMLAPANVQGFCFLSVRSALFSCSEVINGVASLNFRAGEIIREYLGDRGDDSAVRMWHDGSWTRLEIGLARSRDTMHVDFTRCLPDAAGLRWVMASWRDRFFFELALTAAAYGSADVVTGFDGTTAPADPRRLRFVIGEYAGTYEKVTGKTTVDGDVGAMPESLRESAAKDGFTRRLFMNWLTEGLRATLMPRLGTRPPSAWLLRVNGAGVEISLRDSRGRDGIFAELQYRIVLAEETGSGEFDPVPVREKDLEGLRQQIGNWLAELDVAGRAEQPGGFENV